MARFRLTLLCIAALAVVSCRTPEEAAEFRERMDAAFAESMGALQRRPRGPAG